MTREADVAGLEATETERDIRIAIWNGLRRCGVSQDFALVYIRSIMGETCMARALAALSAEPGAGEVERVFQEEIAWEQTQSAKRDIGKKAAACHSYAVFALEGARDKVRALSHAAPAGEG